MEALFEFLDGCDRSGILDGGSFETDTECRYGNLFLALDDLAPVKTNEVGKKHHPRYAAYNRNFLAERDRPLRCYRLDTELYKRRLARDFAHEQIGNSRLDYY